MWAEMDVEDCVGGCEDVYFFSGRVCMRRKSERMVYSIVSVIKEK